MATKKTPKLGKKYPYVRRTGKGIGKVTAITEGKTGAWVTLLDTDLGRSVTVRPSQVG